MGCVLSIYSRFRERVCVNVYVWESHAKKAKWHESYRVRFQNRKHKQICFQPPMPPYYQSCLFFNAIMIPYYPWNFSLFPHFYPPWDTPILTNVPSHQSHSIKLLPFPSVSSHKGKRVIERVRDRESEKKKKKRVLSFISCLHQLSVILGIITINPFLYSGYMWVPICLFI